MQCEQSDFDVPMLFKCDGLGVCDELISFKAPIVTTDDEGELFHGKTCMEVIWDKEISEEFSDVIWDRDVSDELLNVRFVPEVIWDEHLEEMACENVRWDDSPTNQDIHHGLLQQLAMGAEYFVDGKNKLATEILSEIALSYANGASLFFELDVFQAMPKEIVWEADMLPSLVVHKTILQQIALGRQYLDSEMAKKIVWWKIWEQNLEEKLGNVTSAEVCLGGSESDTMLTSTAEFSSAACVVFDQISCKDGVTDGIAHAPFNFKKSPTHYQLLRGGVGQWQLRVYNRCSEHMEQTKAIVVNDSVVSLERGIHLPLFLQYGTAYADELCIIRCMCFNTVNYANQVSVLIEKSSGDTMAMEEKSMAIKVDVVLWPVQMQWDPGIITATAWGQVVFGGGGNVMTRMWPRRSPGLSGPIVKLQPKAQPKELLLYKHVPGNRRRACKKTFRIGSSPSSRDSPRRSDSGELFARLLGGDALYSVLTSRWRLTGGLGSLHVASLVW